MEGMEQMGSKLNPKEAALCEKFIKDNPGMNESDFKELRKDALSTQNPTAKKFYAMHGVIMEEQPDEQTLDELHEHNKTL
jgi:hypothetical protein